MLEVAQQTPQTLAEASSIPPLRKATHIGQELTRNCWCFWKNSVILKSARSMIRPFLHISQVFTECRSAPKIGECWPVGPTLAPCQRLGCFRVGIWRWSCVCLWCDFWDSILIIFSTLGVKPRASHTPGMHSTPEPLS